MQPVADTYRVGAHIQERYQVEDILGKGGFGIVYLVRDQTPEVEQERPGAEHRYALKMLLDRDKKERVRFLFEGEVLTRLNHPALPHIYRTFEVESSQQACVLMDYVEGMNLDILRKRSGEEDISLSAALVLLDPIVEALSYLHSQPSPIIHRDVKPANIIVKKDGKGTVLVDFGIAKEFEVDATTTAIRHCSPGYGAPEQYSGTSTDQRTDVYGLAATLYALLTKTVPADALQRLTRLAGEGKDALIPIKEFVPDIPAPAAAVIHRAMSVDMRKRFPTVREFWQALREATGLPQDDSGHRTHNRRKILPASLSSMMVNKRSQISKQLVYAALAILLLGGLAFGFGIHFGGNHAPLTKRVAISPVHRILSSHTLATSGSYPAVARSYQGEVHDMLSNVTTDVTLTHIKQNNNQISGTFSEAQRQGTFTGVLDSSRHIFFTVSGQPSLFFEGAIRSDGNLVGNYCSIDAAGQCIGSYGIWSFAPAQT